jgi:5'-nucleotidase (lipoprotein e(P4) family)
MKPRGIFALASLVGLILGANNAAAQFSVVCLKPTAQEIQASPPGDDPATWTCEAMSKKPVSGALHWMRGAAEYKALSQAVYQDATRAAERAAKRYGRWGFIVILDADETLLDNLPYQREREICGLSYTAASWCGWANEQKAAPVPGALEFLTRVHRLGGLIAVVTNRSKDEDWVTRENLRKNGLFYDAIRVMDSDPDKTQRWKSVTSELTEVARKLGHKGTAPKPLIWVGDQITDLPKLDAKGNILGARDQSDKGAGVGVNFFLLPNPEYGNWQKSPDQ